VAGEQGRPPSITVTELCYMSLKGALDKIGIGGLLVVAVCCLRLSVVLAFLGAIGLGFLIRNTVLMPVMGIILAAILISLALDYQMHRRPLPLMIAVPSAATLYFVVFVHRVNLAVYLTVCGLILAPILNLIFRRTCDRFVKPARDKSGWGTELK
jgi:hypothetical protein